MKFFTRKKTILKQKINTKSPLIKGKISFISSILSILLSMFITSPIFANNGDFSSITTGLNNLGDSIKAFGLPICTIAVVVGGIMLMCGQRAREIGKITIVGAGIGLIIVNFANPIANMINSF